MSLLDIRYAANEGAEEERRTGRERKKEVGKGREDNSVRAGETEERTRTKRKIVEKERQKEEREKAKRPRQLQKKKEKEKINLGNDVEFQQHQLKFLGHLYRYVPVFHAQILKACRSWYQDNHSQ